MPGTFQTVKVGRHVVLPLTDIRCGLRATTLSVEVSLEEKSRTDDPVIATSCREITDRSGDLFPPAHERAANLCEVSRVSSPPDLVCGKRSGASCRQGTMLALQWPHLLSDRGPQAHAHLRRRLRLSSFLPRPHPPL